MAASSCDRKTRGVTGVLWNQLNATQVGPMWMYPRGSIREPIWNQTNPCYVPCNTYTGENYAPEGTVLVYAPDTDPANMRPFCWSCHGGRSVVGFYTYTGMVHGNGNPVTYGD